jgi:hypothetical protein
LVNRHRERQRINEPMAVEKPEHGVTALDDVLETHKAVKDVSIRTATLLLIIMIKRH